MSNELLFLLHTLCAAVSILIAARHSLEALISLYALFAVLANLFVVKQIELVALTVTCSDVFAIAGVVSLGLIQEYGGRNKAQTAVGISFALTLFFTLMSLLHLAYEPSVHDTADSAYQAILGITPRICLASAITTLIVQLTEVRLYSALNWLLKGRFLAGRLIATLLATQLLDTLLFSLLALYGAVHSIASVIVMSYTLKVLLISSMGNIMGACRRWLDASYKEKP